MTSNDTLEVSAIIYKQLTLASSSRDQQFAVLAIVNQLIAMDAVNAQPKS